MFELSGGETRSTPRRSRRRSRPGSASAGTSSPSDARRPSSRSGANSTYITPVLLGQAAVYEFIRRGSFEPNLVRVNGAAEGAARRDARRARQAPRRRRAGRGPRAATSSGSSCPTGTSASGGARAAPRASRRCSAPTSAAPPNTLRLAYSYVSPDEIDEGVAAARALQAPRSQRPRARTVTPPAASGRGDEPRLAAAARACGRRRGTSGRAARARARRGRGGGSSSPGRWAVVVIARACESEGASNDCAANRREAILRTRRARSRLARRENAQFPRLSAGRNSSVPSDCAGKVARARNAC